MNWQARGPSMDIAIPEFALVVLIGPSGCGKSTFARRHFSPTEVVSSDECRALISDSENNQAATDDAFELLHLIVAKRLKRGRFTVVDATNVQMKARRSLLDLAKEHYCQPIAIVFDLPEDLCIERDLHRPERSIGAGAIRKQSTQLRGSLPDLEREGFEHVFRLTSVDEVEVANVRRLPLPVNRRSDHGPFDIIGDVHGCFDELQKLLDELGYRIASQHDGRYVVEHPDRRRAIFLGDVVDRGPDTPGVLRLVIDMVASDVALCLLGNHEHKLLRALEGRQVRISGGLKQSLDQLDEQPPEFGEQVCRFLAGLVSHCVLDGGRLVVAHAGLPRAMHGRVAPAVRSFALFGDVTGEKDEWGLPVRRDWAAQYRGWAAVAYGHTPVAQPRWVHRTINIDTGCVFGGALTVLQYPEKELISIPAARVYFEPAKPFATVGPLARSGPRGPAAPWSARGRYRHRPQW